MTLHKSIPLAGRHAPHSFEYADAAARTGAVGLVAADVGKTARQLDNNSTWMLTDHAGATWQVVGIDDHGALLGRADDDHPQYRTRVATVVPVVASPYAITVTNSDQILVWLGTGTLTMTLPSSATVGAGWRVRVQNKGFSPPTATVVINRAGGDTINFCGTFSGTNVTTTDQDANIELMSNGAGQWQAALADGTWTNGTITRHFDAHIPGGTSGNLVTIDAKGNLQDGGAAPSGLLKLNQTTPQTVINGRPTLAEGVLLGTTPTVGAHAVGKTYWDTTWKTAAIELEDDVTLQLGQEIHVYCLNNTGGPLVEGEVVYITGASGGIPTVDKAKADSDTTSNALGVVTTTTIADGTYGYVSTIGHVNTVDTSAWNVNDVLYLSATTAGGMTNVAPSSGDRDVKIGRVMVKDAVNGRIFVNIRTQERLTDLSDVTIGTPSVDEVLRFNGVEWVNGAAATSSASSGIEFFPDNTDIIASSAENSFSLETLNKYPVTSAETADVISCASNTVIGSGYLYNTALGRTTIDAGNWGFEFYLAVNSVLAGRVSTVTNNIYQVKPYTSPTVTITGAGTSRTCTASGGTPFALANITPSATNTLASFVKTPKGVYQITARTSDTVVTIATPVGYVNESTVAFSTFKRLFGATSPAITNIAPSYGLYSINTAQPAFTVAVTDKLAMFVFATSNNTTNVTYVYNGTSHYSHFSTPLITLHNNLAGLQGGTATEQYHFTASEKTQALAAEVPLTFSDSLNRAVNTVTLDNDSASPGNGYYYGTNSAGTKGWHLLPVSDGGGSDMTVYSNIAGDFSVAYKDADEIEVFGLPWSINAVQIRRIIRKPTGSAVSVIKTRGSDLVCTWTPDGSITGKGAITTTSLGTFASTDEYIVEIEAAPKGYHLETDSTKAEVTNALYYANDGTIASLSTDSVEIVKPLLAEGYNAFSISATLGDASDNITVLGTNASDGAKHFYDITALALGTNKVEISGAYQTTEPLMFQWIKLVIDGTTGSAVVELTRYRK